MFLRLPPRPTEALSSLEKIIPALRGEDAGPKSKFARDEVDFPVPRLSVYLRRLFELLCGLFQLPRV